MGPKSLPTPVCPSCQGLFELSSSRVPPLGSRYRLTQFWNTQGPQSCKAWSNPDWSPWKGLHWRKRTESSTIAPAAEKPAPVPPSRQDPGCGLQKQRGAGALGEQEGNNSSPRVPRLVGTEPPAGNQPAPSPSQLRSRLPTGSVTGHVPPPRRGTGAGDALARCTRARLRRGSQNLRSTTGCFPQGKSRARLQTRALLWGLCLNSLQMQKGSAGRIHTQGQGAAPRCCTSLAAFHSPIPPSPTHISFVPPFPIPTFFVLPSQASPALPDSLPFHTLLQVYFSAIVALGFAAVAGPRIEMGNYQPWGPLPFTVSGTGIVLVGDGTKPRGAAFMHALAPSLGPSTLSQQ